MDYNKLSRIGINPSRMHKVQDSRMPRTGYDNDDNEITFREWVKQGFPTGGWNVPEESTADARKLVPFYEKQLKAKGLKENEYRVWAEASNLYITVTKEVGDSKVQDSVPEPDPTNSVIYNYEFDEIEHPGFEGSVDDNVLYIFKEGASERTETKYDALASLVIDKMGQVYYNIYRNVSGLRQLCEALKVEIEGQYENEYTSADCSAWTLESELKTQHAIENDGGYWVIKFDSEPTDEEKGVLESHGFEEDDLIWS